jgi:hypothetical protein
MPGLVPAIHASLAPIRSWMPGTRPGMTEKLVVTGKQPGG